MGDLEDTIEVVDLPNFRLEGASAFDVDASGSGTTAEVYTSATVELPEVVRLFVVYFNKQLKSGNVYEVHSAYEATFNKLTDRLYKTSPWPTAEVVSPLVGGDATFLLLYRELYFRHLYSRLTPTLQQRIDSWANYEALFSLLLDGDAPADLALPNQWIWDLVDELIYQFQAWSMFRQRLKSKSAEEIAILKQRTDVWSVTSVLGMLHRLAERAKEPGFASVPLYEIGGYFATVGLLRVQCLLADYTLALKTVEAVDLSRKGLFTKVTSCHISVFYYVAFAYLMSRRYVDAIRTLSQILFYIGRTKQYHTRSAQFEQILKKNEQMYALLAIAISLCPQHQVDENISSTLRDKYGDRMLRMQANLTDLAAYEELFAFSCPKFLSAAPPPYEAPEDYHPQEAYRLQLKLFLAEVKQQAMLPTVRSLLKLYTTIGIPKLAELLDEAESGGDAEGAFREQLQCLKHKTHALVHSGGSPISGSLASSADVDFYVDGDMAHVADSSLTRRHSDYFVRQIGKLDEIIANIKAPAP